MNSSACWLRLRPLPILLLAVLVAGPASAQDASRQQRESIAKGQVLFRKRACAGCHALDGKTDSLGPNLGNLHPKLSRSEALDGLLMPSRTIRKGYESTVVVTEGGQVVTGRKIEETDKTIALLVATEGQVSRREFRKSALDEMLDVPTSIMPVDLLKGLRKEEIDDLLNYLVSIGVIDPLKKTDPHSEHAHHHPSEATPEYTGPDDRLKFDKVDHDVTIGIIPKRMQYDVELFDVRPGSRVKLTLTNRDEMQHNLFICTEGPTTWLDVARSAWALGADGPRLRYVPKSNKVLHHTRLVNPDSADSIYFVAPKKEGVYPYVCTIPGHAFLMRGEMHVLSGKRGLSDLTYRYYEGRWSRLPDFTALEPLREGELSQNLIDIKSDRTAKDYFGYLFSGTLHVAVPGQYRFFLASDDGARIVINDQTVVDHDGVHGDGEQRTGKVRLNRGEHAFQLQFFEAAGGEALYAGWSGPGFKMLPLTAARATLARLNDPSSYELAVEDNPRVMRLNMPHATSRAIAVGLIGGTNYCFDASTCHVRYGWNGSFLNVGPDRGFGRGRGGGECKPLGQVYAVAPLADNRFPLRIADDSAAVPTFLGYSRSILGPTFRYRVGATEIQQYVEASPSGRGLQFHFQLHPPPQSPVSLDFDPGEHLERSSSNGQWTGSRLSIPAAQAQDFTVTLEPRS